MQTKSNGVISLIKKPLVYKLLTGVCVTMVTIHAIFISPFLSRSLVFKGHNSNTYTGFSLPGRSTVMEFKTQILEVGQILEIQTQLLRCARL